MRKVSRLAGLTFITCGLLFGQEEREGIRQPLPAPRVEKVPQTITFTGRVTTATGDPLPGAYIKVVGSVQGTVSGADGGFRLMLIAPPDPIQVEVSFVGYKTLRRTLSLAESSAPLTFALEEADIQAQEVVISASRISETFQTSPITIQKMSLRELNTMPGVSFFQNIPLLKGVDLIYSSFTFPIVNARGFNSPNNPRFVHRIDGVEMQSAGLNIPLGMLTSPPEIDMENVEVILGPASALYGPNAFNGIMNIQTRNPFQYPGLSASVRLGANHIDGQDVTAQPYYDIAARYAHTWGQRFGIKVIVQGMRAYDWVANNTTDRGIYDGASGRYAIPGPENPGYDAINRYGDEIRITPTIVRSIANRLVPLGIFPADTNDLDFYLSRTGYWEKDLVRYRAQVLRGSIGAYYRLSDKVQLSYAGWATLGSTVYQSANRYALQDAIVYASKVELHTPSFRLWGYVVGDDAGKSYDARFTGINMLRRVKPDPNWFVQYVWAYTGQLRRLAEIYGADPVAMGIPAPGDHAAARQYADSDAGERLAAYLRSVGGLSTLIAPLSGGAQPLPGSPAFRQLFDEITAYPNFAQGGSRFIDQSRLYHIETQYEITPLQEFAQVLVGGNFRYYHANSRGTIFSDSTSPIGLWEAGAFVQLSRSFWRERVRFITAGRYDKNQNFKGQITPRIAVMFALDDDKKHIVRFAYQTGFRMPTLQAQYLDLDLGPFKFIGGLTPSDRAYGIIGNNYSLASVQAFLAAYEQRSLGSANPQDYAGLLRSLDIQPIRPERNRCIEVGSRHILGDKLYIDIDYAFSRYWDFLGTIDLVGPIRYPQGEGRYYMGQLTADSIALQRYAVYRRYYNSSTPVSTHSASVLVQYAISSRFAVSGNFGYADILLTEEARNDALIAGFNTPRYKASAYFIGRELTQSRRMGFTIGYRWVNAYLFQEPFHEQIIPTYQLVDAQISYRFPRWKSTLRIGGQNILNNRHLEVPGGPMIGGLYYVQWVFDPFMMN